MPDNSTAPIVIIGAGIAGLTLGHLLTKAGGYRFHLSPVAGGG